MGQWTIGIDVGGTEIKMGLFDDELRAKWSIPTNIQENGSHILTEIAESIVGKCGDMGIGAGDLAGAGIGLPGPVLDGNIVKGCVNLGWSDVAVADELSVLLKEAFKRRNEGLVEDRDDSFSFRVQAANDANVAALGEMWLGGGKNCRSLVMVTLGTGVGGGIVVDGRIINGSSGCAGEIGHIICVEEADIVGKCNCGNRGCLEQIASATGIVQYARHYLSELDIPSILRDLLKEHGKFGAKDVLDAAKSGDAAAVYIMDRITMYLGRALAGICAVVNPECILIGGGVSLAGEYLRAKVEQHFKEQAFPGLKNTPVRLAVLENEAGIAGAAYMISKMDRKENIL